MNRNQGSAPRNIAVQALFCVLVMALTPALCAAQEAGAVTFSQEELEILLQMSPLPPVPPDRTNRVADDPAAARVGQFLFFDTRFSSNGQLSCVSCHDPGTGFSDGKSLSEGLKEGRRHAATLWNAAYSRWFFWDGRADTLWSQAIKPLESPNELGSSRLEIAHLVSGDAQLREAYETVFGALPDLSDPARFPASGRPDPTAPEGAPNRAWSRMRVEDQETVNRILVNLAKCVAAYERKLVSRRAPFDRFVEGLRNQRPEATAELSESAQRGLRMFIGRGNCRLCHSGANFTDGEFHDTRVPPLRGRRPSDPGRYEGAGELLGDPFNAAGPYSDDRDGEAAQKLTFLANGQQNWGLFKTPTLRNIARTAPYMHQGQFKTLREVVRFYSTFSSALTESHHPERILVPLHLTKDEMDDLEAFLESLTDESLPADLLQRPALPVLRRESKP